MPRWQGGARERLERAALELFAEQGFQQTTVEQVAQRAGLTRRTFFRHFPDKREVLFDVDDRLAAAIGAAAQQAPPDAAPLDVLLPAVLAGAALVDELGELARLRRRVIGQDESLREREWLKREGIVRRMRDLLAGRGVTEPTATLAAETAAAVFAVAYQRWGAEPQRTMTQVTTEVMEALGGATLTAHTGGTARR